MVSPAPWVPLPERPPALPESCWSCAIREPSVGSDLRARSRTLWVKRECPDTVSPQQGEQRAPAGRAEPHERRTEAPAPVSTALSPVRLGTPPPHPHSPLASSGAQPVSSGARKPLPWGLRGTAATSCPGLPSGSGPRQGPHLLAVTWRGQSVIQRASGCPR